MDIQTLAMDSYQSTLITGMKINALLKTLTDEQKEIYEKELNEQVAEMTKKLEGNENTDQVLEILRSLQTG